MLWSVAASAQNYTAPGVPSGTTSFTPTFRYKPATPDSSAQIWQSIGGNKWYRMQTGMDVLVASQINFKGAGTTSSKFDLNNSIHLSDTVFAKKNIVLGDVTNHHDSNLSIYRLAAPSPQETRLGIRGVGGGFFSARSTTDTSDEKAIVIRLDQSTPMYMTNVGTVYNRIPVYNSYSNLLYDTTAYKLSADTSTGHLATQHYVDTHSGGSVNHAKEGLILDGDTVKMGGIIDRDVKININNNSLKTFFIGDTIANNGLSVQNNGTGLYQSYIAGGHSDNTIYSQISAEQNGAIDLSSINGSDSKNISINASATGIEISDSGNVGLIGNRLFPVSGDPNQYVQAGNLTSLDSNIYNKDGTITSPKRTVSMNGDTLLFRGQTASDSVAVTMDHGDGMFVDTYDKLFNTESYLSIYKSGSELTAIDTSGQSASFFASTATGAVHKANAIMQVYNSGLSKQIVMESNSGGASPRGIYITNLLDSAGMRYHSYVDYYHADSLTLMPKQYIDSVASAGGGGTVTSVSAGTGMNFTTITSTGSVNADTTFLRTVANSYSLSGMQTKLNNYVLSSALLNHVAGYGLSGSNYNTSVSQTWTADTTSSTGLVSKSRLSTNLGGYVPTTRTVNGKALSSNITLALASSDFANQGTTTTVLHGNASGNPSWGAVSLTADVTGLLPNANLANSSVTFNGVSVALGGSGTITGLTPNSLTFGRGLNGGSWNGSVALTTTLDTSQAYKWLNLQTIDKSGLGATTTAKGLVVQNSTASTSGATAQVSPSVEINGTGWNSSASASQVFGLRVYAKPTAGNPPGGTVFFDINQNGTYTNFMTENNSTGIAFAPAVLFAAQVSTNSTISAISSISSGDAANTTSGKFILKGKTSGTVTTTVADAAGTYNWIYPTTAGAALNVLTSQAGGTTAMTWSSVPIIQATADLTAQTSAGNITTFVVGSSTATFDISSYLNVTAISTDIIQVQITYTDENNTAQTISLANTSTVTNANYSPVTIRAKNATTITVKTNLSTGGGSITFDAGARIIQLP